MPTFTPKPKVKPQKKPLLASVVPKGEEKRIEIKAGRPRRQYRSKTARFEYQTDKFRMRDRALQHELKDEVYKHFYDKREAPSTLLG